MFIPLLKQLFLQNFCIWEGILKDLETYKPAVGISEKIKGWNTGGRVISLFRVKGMLFNWLIIGLP